MAFPDFMAPGYGMDMFQCIALLDKIMEPGLLHAEYLAKIVVSALAFRPKDVLRYPEP